jgi:hypothetical protein
VSVACDGLNALVVVEQFLCYSPKSHRTARHRARCERDRRASASHQVSGFISVMRPAVLRISRFISTQLPAGFPPEVRHFFGGLCNINAFSRLFELMEQVGHRPLKSQFCLQLTTAFCRILLMGEFVFHVDPHPRSFRNSGSQVRSSQQPLILVEGLDVWFIPACNILYVYPIQSYVRRCIPRATTLDRYMNL